MSSETYGENAAAPVPEEQSPSAELSRRTVRAKYLRSKWESGAISVRGVAKAFHVARGTAHTYLLSEDGPPSERWTVAPEWLRKGAP